jgi:hypothetical protein
MDISGLKDKLGVVVFLKNLEMTSLNGHPKK